METKKRIGTYDLNQFTGTENHWKDPFFPKFRYTDGIKFLRDNGLNWLIVDILSYSRMEDFQIWQFNRTKNLLFMTFDWDEKNPERFPIIVKKQYDFTDFPMESIKIYCCGNVLLLPSEY